MLEGLGRSDKATRALVRVKIREIRQNPYQPREAFDEKAIERLAQSIRENGLISPIALRRAPGGGYFLVAGERRLRALRLLGKTCADAVILDADEAESRVLSLIENVQREDLSFFEEARALKEILKSTGMTQDALARRVGASPSAVANRLRLLKLPEEVRNAISEGKLTERHARALLVLEGLPTLQLMLAREAAQKGLNVKQTERRAEEIRRSEQAPKRRVKTLFRDQRMAVNAVRETVRKLTQTGVNATLSVEEDEREVRAIVAFPKAGSEADGMTKPCF